MKPSKKTATNTVKETIWLNFKIQAEAPKINVEIKLFINYLADYIWYLWPVLLLYSSR